MTNQFRRSQGSAHVLNTTAEYGPFGECPTLVNFIYCRRTVNDDQVAIIVDGEFYYNGHWVDLDCEAANNISADTLRLCLEHAEREIYGDVDQADENYERLVAETEGM